MTGRVSAAPLRIAAIGVWLLLPAAVRAQLKCVNDTDREIRRVSFTGNVRFTDAELQRHVLAEPTDKIKRYTHWFGTSRCLRAGLLSSDSARLRAFYADQGFPYATVAPSKRDIGTHWVDISFGIVEGQSITVDSVSIEGLSGLALGQDLAHSLHTRVGARFSGAFVQSDIDTIETRLRNSGYPQGVVLRDIHVDTTTNKARVGLNVMPGPRTRIGSITIVDTAITGKGAVINEKSIRQLLTFKEGDLYSERALNESQRQLYQIGTFYHAEVADTAHHTPTDSLVDIHVLVVEDYMRQFNYRAGWGTQDCFQTGAQYFDKAFAHSINRLEMNAQVSKLGWASPTDVRGVRDLCRPSLFNDVIASSRLNYTTSVRLTQPASFGGRLDRSFAAYSEVRGAYKAYLRTTLIGGAANLSKLLDQQASPSGPFKRTLIGQVGYNLEYGHADAPQAVLCFIFRACTDPEREQLSKDRPLAIVSGVVSRDWRDNPLIPRSGTLARVEGRLSSKLLGSDTTLQFRKGITDLTWYHPGIKSDVVAIRFRGGIIGGGAAAGARLVPQQERLYTGGETSVRGFPQNELGPLIYVVERATFDTTATGVDTLFAAPTSRRIPTGGNSMMVWNLEYRVHGPFFGDRLQTILFADAGKLWTRGVDVSQPFKWTPGVAFRVFSPVGPIQVNIGYNNYGTPLGPVFYDPGIGGSTAPLVCVVNSAPHAGPTCPASFSIPRPAKFLPRLHFSIAFPPDY